MFSRQHKLIKLQLDSRLVLCTYFSHYPHLAINKPQSRSGVIKGRLWEQHVCVPSPSHPIPTVENKSNRESSWHVGSWLSSTNFLWGTSSTLCPHGTRVKDFDIDPKPLKWNASADKKLPTSFCNDWGSDAFSQAHVDNMGLCVCVLLA